MSKSLLVFFLILTLSGISLGQNRPEPAIYAHSGFSIPGSMPCYFPGYWKSGLNFGIGIGIPLGTNFILQSFFAYNNLNLDKDVVLRSETDLFESTDRINNGMADTYTFSVHLGWFLQNIRCHNKPYLSAGFGVLKLNIPELIVNDDIFDGKKQNAFCIMFGVGYDYKLNDRFGLFFQGDYVIGFTSEKNISYVPIRIGFSVHF